jgi:hypothetical protein
MELMDNAPYDFVISHTESDLEKILRSSLLLTGKILQVLLEV